MAAGGAWLAVAPPLTGPDEVAQARRAAAVVRGQFTGSEVPGTGNLTVSVDVPPAFGVPADEQWRCHLGPLVEGAPQADVDFGEVACPVGKPRPDDDLVAAPTGQHRGQPAFSLWVGLPSLVRTDATGVLAMRLLGLLPAAALLASAGVSVQASRARRRAGLGLLACITPAVLYLAAVLNPAGIEIAAALSAWAAGALLATGRQTSSRVVARFGVALIILIGARGLGPLFAGLVFMSLATLAGASRCRVLVRRPDVRGWAVVAVVATALSGWWLAWIHQAWPLADRPGSGLAHAAGLLPWFLHQSVGVFGSNDSALPEVVAACWVLVTLALMADGLRQSTRRMQVVAPAVVLAGLALSVVAEGASIPPIGFFWQGRYALPLLVGAVLVAACSPARGRPQATGAHDDRAGFQFERIVRMDDFLKLIDALQPNPRLRPRR